MTYQATTTCADGTTISCPVTDNLVTALIEATAHNLRHQLPGLANNDWIVIDSDGGKIDGAMIYVQLVNALGLAEAERRIASYLANVVRDDQQTVTQLCGELLKN